jgi:predicted GNAT family acetyltransferase
MSTEDEQLDETLEESFPASDPPANTVETGVRVGAPPSPDVEVTDHPERQRFETTVEGVTAFLAYERTSSTLRIIHTEVPAALRGRHVGDALVQAALDAGHSAGLRVEAICPFARAYLRRQAASKS